MPKQCSRHADNHGKTSKVEPKGGADGDWKGNVKFGADHAVENKREAVNETTDNDAVDCLAPKVKG